MNISEEQRIVVDKIQLNYNVVVDSVAGSGKTTCSMFIAKHLSDMKILLLTYNSKLKFETRQRVISEGINNVEVHSYHSFCVRHYNNNCFTDSEMRELLKPEIKPIESFCYDLVIVDEAQDMTPLYYQLVYKLCSHNKRGNKTQLCVFGDRNQSIFGFNHSDARFIELVEDVFRYINTLEWWRTKLSTSFRVTKPMAEFLNTCLLDENRIHAVKESCHKPRYIICDCFDPKNTLQEIEYYRAQGYAPEDIFVLAPSVRSGKMSPVRNLENAIKTNMPDVMVYIPGTDEEKMNIAVIKGKLVFSTFHQAKGLERKVVIVLGFDQSYYKYYNHAADPFKCSNELYVAVTRATERITLYHNKNNLFMEFIDPQKLMQYCEFILASGKFPTGSRERISEKPIRVSVTDLIRHLPDEVLDRCFGKLTIDSHPEFIYNKLDIPQLVETSNNMVETVTELTGIAIPSMFEYTIKRKMSIFDSLIRYTTSAEVRKTLSAINLETISSEQLLYVANCWNTYNSGYLFKLYQITEYKWLDEAALASGIQRLDVLRISQNSIFEESIVSQPSKELHGRILSGAVDCIDLDNKIVYEFKCTQTTKREHFIQLALYMYLHKYRDADMFQQNAVKQPYSYVIFNIFTNEHFTISCTDESLKWIVNTLMHEKYKSASRVSDELFIENCRQLANPYVVQEAPVSAEEAPASKEDDMEEIRTKNNFYLHITMEDLGFVRRPKKYNNCE